MLNFELTFIPSEDLYVTFMHVNPENRSMIYHIGWDHISRILIIPNHLKQLPEYQKPVTVVVMTTHATKLEAMVGARDFNRSFTSLTRNRVGAKAIGIRCITTNKMYPSIKGAADDIGCSPSAISNHLSKRKGYETVHGLRFEKVQMQ